MSIGGVIEGEEGDFSFLFEDDFCRDGKQRKVFCVFILGFLVQDQFRERIVVLCKDGVIILLLYYQVDYGWEVCQGKVYGVVLGLEMYVV